mgnify:CR=1 FL=1
MFQFDRLDSPAMWAAFIILYAIVIGAVLYFPIWIALHWLT